LYPSAVQWRPIRPRSAPVRAARTLVVGVLVAVAALALGAAFRVPVASAGTRAQSLGIEQIQAYDSDVRIEANGSLLVSETIHYDFGVVPHHGIFRDIPDRFDYPNKKNTDRVTPISVVSVRASAGTPADFETSDKRSGNNGYLELKIGDPDRTITGLHTYEIKYRVKGALNAFPDHDELVWNAVGNEWTVPVARATAEVTSPAAIPRVACAEGAFGSNLPCRTATVTGSTATFGQDDLAPHEGLTFTVAIPKGAVPPPKPILEERFSLAKAFTANGATVGGSVALLILLVGGYLLLLRRFGRDRRYRGSAVDQAFGPGAVGDGADGSGADEIAPLLEHTETPVEFVPPDGLRPGQVGTLIDFAANPLDVTATIVDLAVRKYLVIEEVPREGHFSKADWKLTKLKDDADELKEYERVTLHSLFRDGDEVELSDLRNKFAARLTTIRKDLMDDAMGQGWFTHRPERSRALVGGIGAVVLAAGVGATIALAAATHAALFGIPLIVLGVLVLATARLAPARTAKGNAVMRHVAGFRRFIDESEKERARFAERKNLFSEYLPYAIVFGATKKWAHAFAGLDGEPPDMYWYHSLTPFDALLFVSAVDSFAVATAGTLTSVPAASGGASGFSGGGFSGGGFGGGGGGSW
jgi:uncharacterized membrane protein YgcG